MKQTGHGTLSFEVDTLPDVHITRTEIFFSIFALKTLLSSGFKLGIPEFEFKNWPYD
jgi:hypothetical protein